jgi:hypothetical protein
MAARQPIISLGTNPVFPPEPYSDDSRSWTWVLFRHIGGWPGYGVDTLGDVWSCRKNSGRIGSTWFKRRLTRRKSGHLFVGLSKAGSKMGMFGVHRLVLETFIGQRPDGMCCRHLNGIAWDNRLRNLCWGTHQENSDDMDLHGTRIKGVDVYKAKLDEEKVAKIRSLYRQGYAVRRLAREYEVRPYTIKLAVEGKTWAHVTNKEI